MTLNQLLRVRGSRLTDRSRRACANSVSASCNYYWRTRTRCLRHSRAKSAVPPFPRQQVAPVRRLCPPARWTPPAHSRRSTRRYRAPNGPGPARWPEMGQCHLANGRGRHSHAERIKGGAPNMRFNSASAWVTAGWLVAMCSRSVGLPALRAGAAAHASESQH